MEIQYEDTADHVELADTISFNFEFADDEETVQAQELMIVSSIDDAGTEIVIKGESLTTGDTVVYALEPDHVIYVMGV